MDVEISTVEYFNRVKPNIYIPLKTGYVVHGEGFQLCFKTKKEARKSYNYMISEQITKL